MLTTTVIVVVVAQSPFVGVKVYTVLPADDVFMAAGFHVPAIPFVDVVGSTPGVDPIQYGPKAVNVGVTLLLIFIVEVVELAHNPAVGVNVYVVVALLFIAGLQVPVIPFVDVVGNAGIEAPEQYGPAELKVGVTLGVIVIVRVVCAAHWPAVGVKVYIAVFVLLIAGLHVPVIPLVDVVGSAGIAAPAQ